MALFQLKSEDFCAEINSVGATLMKLSFNGRDLIEPTPAISRYHGALLAPWPNRIRDGKYSFQGKFFKTGINEVTRNNALHGLINSLEFELKSQTKESLHLTGLLKPGEEYPSELKFDSYFVLENNGLHWSVTCENVGTSNAPFGISIHPYLVTGRDLKIDDCFLRFASDEYVEVDDQRLLPIEVRSVNSRDFNFNSRNKIGSRFIDHAFKVPSEVHERCIELTDENGVGTFMQYDDGARWIQIHTADREGGPDSRKSLAVEPMSCPPDAFNSGIDLVDLAPTQQFEMSWKIGPLQ